jgi:hypothetical protein
MSEERQKVKTALRQLECAEDYLEAVASLLPEYEGEIDRMVDGVAALKEHLGQRRLAGAG